MSDIVERAEKVLADLRDSDPEIRAAGRAHGTFLVPELVAELKAARAEIAEQKEWIKELTTSDE